MLPPAPLSPLDAHPTQYVATIHRGFVEGEGGLVYDAAGRVYHLPHFHFTRTSPLQPMPQRTVAQASRKLLAAARVFLMEAGAAAGLAEHRQPQQLKPFWCSALPSRTRFCFRRPKLAASSMPRWPPSCSGTATCTTILWRRRCPGGEGSPPPGRRRAGKGCKGRPPAAQLQDSYLRLRG
jgi:hypothetical protein